MDAFYEYYEKKNIEMVNVDIHSFTADNLTPDTSYEFSVVALDDSGNPIGDTASVSASTAPAPEIFNITDFGARTLILPIVPMMTGSTGSLKKIQKQSRLPSMPARKAERLSFLPVYSCQALCT